MNSFITLSPQQLRKAADVKEKIDALQTELARILGTPSETSGDTPAKTMSPATRARIAAAARKRWANTRRNSSSGRSQPKRILSPAARAHLAAIARARWKSAKSAGKTAL
jgi:hypothetical protein